MPSISEVCSLRISLNLAPLSISVDKMLIISADNMLAVFDRPASLTLGLLTKMVSSERNVIFYDQLSSHHLQELDFFLSPLCSTIWLEDKTVTVIFSCAPFVNLSMV